MPEEEGTSQIHIDPHPILLVSVFETLFPKPLGHLPTPAKIKSLLSLNSPAPLSRSEEIRKKIREMLRYSGYKPAGRGKPASEYLVRAATEGKLSSINAAVDVCNAVSLHSGLPISLVDAGKVRRPLRIGVAPQGSSYVFNPSGQKIRLDGLLCLMDSKGPCANAVKDSQRTKTDDQTVRTLSVVWACKDLKDHLEKTVSWYRELLSELGAKTHILTHGGS